MPLTLAGTTFTGALYVDSLVASLWIGSRGKRVLQTADCNDRAGFREHEYVHLSPWMGTTWRTAGARWSINLLSTELDRMDVE